MTRDEAVTRIQQGLGFRTTLATTIVARLKEEQRDLERGKTLPKFLIQEDETLSLLIATQEVALPGDFLRRSSNLLRYTPTGTTKSLTIPWREKDAAYEVYSEADASGPKVAVLQKGSIFFLPVADMTYPITWDYYAKGEILDTDIENSWLEFAPELLIGGAGLRIARDLRDNTAIQLFMEMYKQSRQTWYGETIVQETEDGPLILGSDA